MNGNKLKARWSKVENDIMIYYPNKCDGHMLWGFLKYAIDPTQAKCFLDTLKDRGYDITTLKFEITKLQEK